MRILPSMCLCTPTINRVLEITDDGKRHCGHAYRKPVERGEHNPAKFAESRVIGQHPRPPRVAQHSAQAVDNRPGSAENRKPGYHAEDMPMRTIQSALDREAR